MSGGDARPSRLFTIAPGVPFLPTLVDALCDGALVDGFRFEPHNPLGLADASIYVPTRRAARALRSDFVDHIGAQSAILPVIRALGETDDDGGFFDERTLSEELLPPVAPTAALLELASLILAWKTALPASIDGFHADSPLIAPASPADAVWLARGLADLLDAMETHERPWSQLERLDAADHAEWWQLTLEFLKIASDFWPARLAELNRSSAAGHRNALLAGEAERLLRQPPKGPVIVAGSTGSIPATAHLMAAIAKLEQGALVLPGLDTAIPQDVWPLVAGTDDPERPVEPAVLTHPQYGLALLLGRLRATRADVRTIGEESHILAARNHMVSRALLPARATALWAPDTASEASNAPLSSSAFDDVALIEAAGEREEAAAIATAMRMAGEDAQARVALVTPDRNLARRVAIELQRFGIEANDSGGSPLSASAQATFLTLLLDAVMQPGDPVALVGLINHPLARFGMDGHAAAHAASCLERLALRGTTGAVDVATLTTLVDQAIRTQANDRHPPHWRERMTADDQAKARALAETIERMVEPLAGRFVRFAGADGMAAHGIRIAAPIADWVRDTLRVAEQCAADPVEGVGALWGDEAGERLVALFSDLLSSRADLTANGEEWAEMLAAFLAGETIKPRAPSHPRIFIWGALEARLQDVDTIVLGGLNEGSWPSQTANDPFLSRAMKIEIGLEPPERRIGLAAHDFQMAMGAPHVILSRAGRANKAPTIASRWLQRLLVVVGDDIAAAMRRRGAVYLRHALRLDQSAAVPLAERPAPRPPVEAQPKRYSFSEVKTLRRDPYAIYARKVLKLDPLAPLIRDPGVAERGTLYHRILESFTGCGLDPADPGAGDRLAAIAERLFQEEALPEHISVLWRSRFASIATLFIAWERERNDRIASRNREVPARTILPITGVTLTGIADRIDTLGDGRAEIIDYKTGLEPSRKQARALLDPQLPLEAWVLGAGGFKGLGAIEPASLQYVRLRAGEVLRVDMLEGFDRAGAAKDDGSWKSAADLGEDAVRQLERFVQVLASRQRGFASRLIPASARDYGNDYDHLARVAEWASSEADQGGEEMDG